LFIGISKTKTRLVHREDDKRVAVPPQFSLATALCDRPSSVYAVTGNPVPVYLISDWLLFFGIQFGRLQRCSPADASTNRILLCQVTGLDMPFATIAQGYSTNTLTTPE
jgi:hypothetical protein